MGNDQQSGRGVDQSQQHVRKEKSQKEVVHIYDEIEEPTTKEEQRVTSETMYEDLNKEASKEAVEHMYGRTDVAKLESPHTVYEDLDKEASRGAVEHMYGRIDVVKLESPLALTKQFMVTVEPCALAKHCDIEDAMTMLVTKEGIAFEDPRTRQIKYVFQLRWMRRYGFEGKDLLYFECGRTCPNGEGIIRCVTPCAKEIHGLIKELVDELKFSRR